jgi:hypothetical protein
VQAISLDQLILTGGSITNGDKIFSDFTFQSTDYGASNIDIIARTDSFGFGIRLQGGINAMEGEQRDALVGFSVTAPSPLITDLHLQFNGAILGPFSVAEVIETVFDSQMNLMTNFFVRVAPGQAIYQDTLFFASPQQKLYILKDILVTTRDTQFFDWASISFVDQTFSQIPEPSPFALAAFGLIALRSAYARVRRLRS